MKEVRLTFASAGLEAVSKVLLELGISFRVEPVDTAAKQETTTEAAPAAKPRTAARPARKASKAKRAARPATAASADATSPGAERLRAAIAQSGTAFRSPLAPPAGTREPDPPAGLVPASDQPDEHAGD